MHSAFRELKSSLGDRLVMLRCSSEGLRKSFFFQLTELLIVTVEDDDDSWWMLVHEYFDVLYSLTDIPFYYGTVLSFFLYCLEIYLPFSIARLNVCHTHIPSGGIIKLFCIALYRIEWPHMVLLLYCNVLYCILLYYYIVSYCVIPYCFAFCLLYHIISYCIVLRCFLLYRIVLHCIVLYCT